MRTGIGEVDCSFSVACGNTIQATDINKLAEMAIAAAQRGDTVLSLSGLYGPNEKGNPIIGWGKNDDIPYPGAVAIIRKFENAGYDRFRLFTKFCLYNSNDRVRIIYYDEISAPSGTALFDSDDDSYSNFTEYEEITEGSINLPPTGQAIDAWLYLEVTPQTGVTDPSFPGYTYLGIMEVNLKLYKSCA